MKRFVLGALLTFAFVLDTAGARASQDILRAAAVVNDEVISMLDLDMRMRLAIIAIGQPDSAQLRSRIASQVMRRLIDERLQFQEAQRLDITVPDDRVADAVGQIARRNNLTAEGFLKRLNDQGILPEALVAQVRAQLTWRALVSRRLRPSVQATEEEVEEVVNRVVANRGVKQRRVSEIFLAMDTARQEDEVRGNAERLLQQLRAGANFAALARQFSGSAAAARGGDLGWVQDGQLPEELDRALASMRPGTLSAPIRTLSGFHIILLREERQTSVGDVMLHLKQVLFALPDDVPAEQTAQTAARAAEAAKQIDGCAGVDDLAQKVGSPGSGDLGIVKLTDLPPGIRNAVTALPVGQPSQAIRVSGGVSVLVVCERTESGIDRKRIKERLINQKLDMLARRYMRDLRRNANVDIRI